MTNDSFDLSITSYSKKGYGIGKIQKKGKSFKVEVTNSVIGDCFEIDATQLKKRVLSSSLLTLKTPSEQRVNPRCSHALSCGGCPWQQVSYSAQIQEKQNLLHRLFDPLLQEGVFHPILSAKTPWHYRNKMELTFSQDRQGQRFFGLMMNNKKRRVVTLDHCYLAPPWFIIALKAVYKWWTKSTTLLAYHPPSNAGTLRTLTLREGKHTGERMVILTVSGCQEHFLKRADLVSFKKTLVDTFPNVSLSIFLRIHHIKKGQPSAFYEMHLYGKDKLREILHVDSRAIEFHMSPSSFFQIHSIQAQHLLTCCLQLAKPTLDLCVYDLYAGIGTLSLVFAPFVKKILSVEKCPYAVCDAQVNMKLNGFHHVRVIEGDATSDLLQLSLYRPDLIIVDPPRAGLQEGGLNQLDRLLAKQILYISCNVVTQSEDIKHLISKGYDLKAIQPVDQFPHTPHIENIALLERTRIPPVGN